MIHSLATRMLGIFPVNVRKASRSVNVVKITGKIISPPTLASKEQKDLTVKALHHTLNLYS